MHNKLIMQNVEQFVARQTSAKMLLEMDSVKKFHLPKPDCSLLKNQPDYYEKIVAKQVRQILKSEITDQKDFNVSYGFSDGVLYGYLIISYLSTGQTIDDLIKEWGFDANSLADPTYMTKMICKIDPSSPFIANLPDVNPILNQDQANFAYERQLLALKYIAEGGKIRAGRNSFVPPHCEEIIKRCKNVYITYFFAKFKAARFRNDAKAVLDYAQSDPLVGRIIQESGILTTLNINALDLTPQQLQLANSLNNTNTEALQHNFNTSNLTSLQHNTSNVNVAMPQNHLNTPNQMEIEINTPQVARVFDPVDLLTLVPPLSKLDRETTNDNRSSNSTNKRLHKSAGLDLRTFFGNMKKKPEE